MDTNTILVTVLATLAVGGIAHVFLYPILSGERRAEKRQESLITRRERDARVERVSSATRREQIAANLKEIEARQNAKAKISLERRLAQAGLDWSKSRFFVVSGILGVVVGLVLLVATGNLVVAGLGLFAGGLGLPRWLLGFRAKKRIEAFIDELPNAIDMIVRGIKSGLPLGDCLREIARSTRDPLRTEFRLMMESQAVGVPISEAVQRLAERIPVPEANFFAIVIGIQAQAGGNLSEALGNLSRVLRDRKRMQGKIKAMSMEAKASAAIIASLPFMVVVLLYLSSPEYISLLWTTPLGQISMVGCAVWMTMGVLVMRQMINFDF